MTLKPFTVLYVEEGFLNWQGFNCHAEDADHAEEQCLDAYPDCDVIWVNQGENNFQME